MNSVRVSVIVGYYKRRAVLGKTIDSLMSQSFRDFEIIVFDDASKDGTAEALAELSTKYDDARFRYRVHEKNRGFVNGLVDAISDARGEYIAIQGSGDVSLPRRLEYQVALLDGNPDVGLVGSWYRSIKEETNDVQTVRPNANDVELSDLMQRNYFTHGEVMFRRSVYERAGGYRREFKYVQDLDLWLRMRRFARFATVQEILYERYIRTDGVTSNLEKFTEQVRYPVLARRLARMSAEEQHRSLALVRERGPGAVVPTSDPAVQRKYFRYATDLAHAGRVGEALVVTRDHIARSFKRTILLILFRTYSIPILGRFVRWGIAALRQFRSRPKGSR